MEAILNKLVSITETFLSWRKRRKWEKKEKQRKKNPIIDWLDALIWAAVVVLLVNQYLLQAYAIPSGSMKNSLMEQDRIFVNKIIFGPEILPGIGKIPGFTEPKRGDIIIFENPLYESKGPVFDIAQRFIYMVTLSLVDIDAGSFHFLIKRQVGDGGDWLRLRRGELEIRPLGESEFIKERDFEKISGLDYKLRRLHTPEYYTALEKSARATAWNELGLTPESGDLEGLATLGKLMHSENLTASRNDLLRLYVTKTDDKGHNDSVPTDEDETIRLLSQYNYQISPFSEDSNANYHRYIYHARMEKNSRATLSHISSGTGQYLPIGWLLPLGDNRDNSRDGRVWGPIQKDKILGQAAFRYWPIGQFGEIR